MIEHLFIYGTLAPNRPNHHIMTPILNGIWTPATIRGKLIAEGWGATLGYPAVIPDDTGDVVQGFVFSSDDLGNHWQRLDEFEGEGYERVSVMATLENGQTITAFVYALNQDC